MAEDYDNNDAINIVLPLKCISASAIVRCCNNRNCSDNCISYHDCNYDNNNNNNNNPKFGCDELPLNMIQYLQDHSRPSTNYSYSSNKKA